MLRNLMPWNRSGRTTHNNRRRAARQGRRFRVGALGEAHLSLEPLETRHVLSASPVLTVVGSQMVNEGAPLSITDLGTFTDVVEGGAIGLNPNSYTSLGAFDPLSDVTINTDTLAITGGFLGTGVTMTANAGFGAFNIAVFAFGSFELDAGRKITATGSRPLAILSQNDLSVAGTIDVSAVSDVAGAGGGMGGATPPPLDGDDALGAPTTGGGTLGPGGAGGSGGGFGGAGGAGSAGGSPSGNGLGGAALGGVAYANLSSAIQGGSGGSTGGSGATPRTGGGGGGGIELGAVSNLVIASTGSVLANGGNGASSSGTLAGGGGGAGGGILLHAANVTQNGTLSAKGGAGGNGTQRGGGGGGGEILVASASGSYVQHLGTEDVSGGAQGLGSSVAVPGQNGHVTVTAAAPVIETFNYVINWGDSSPNSTGPATIDVPGVNAGDGVQGSFDGNHTYADNGVYTVTVTINDNNGGTDTETFSVTVNNVAPTLAISGASSVNEGSSYTLNLSSSDPGTDTISQWTIDWGDGIEVVSGNPTSVSHTYADGDNNYTISATATDEDGIFAAGNTVGVAVLNVAPTANAGGSYQTFDDTPITLHGTATDPAGVLDPLTFSWDLDNNGTFETTGANATFDPVALGFSGTVTRTVQLRVSDGDGGVTTTTTTVQLLGEGTLLIDNVLYVVGNNSACDIVLITQCNSTIQVFATFNSSNPASFNVADVNEIQVRTRGGHDIVVTSANVTKVMTIDGGSGNDLLTGGGGRNLILGGTGSDVLYGASGDDVLLGGDGNDDLIGGSGNDVLVGGNGRDILRGGAGRDLIIGSQDNDLLDGGGDEDILIGGYTIHDNNVAALDAVMAIWGSSASFNARVATLTSSGGLLQAGVAVFDDDDGDILLGGSGRDLIFGDNNPWDGAVDLMALQPLQDVLVAVT